MRRFWLLASLWAVLVIRVHRLLTLPVFVDESLHIMRAQVVFDFTDAVASFLPGKLLTYYYFGLFGPENSGGLWLCRAAIALTAPLCAALCYGLTRKLGGDPWAGLLAVWLYALSPFLIFFERMALTDTFAGLFALGLSYAALYLAENPTRRRAVLTGSLLGLALLAKLTALPLVIIPPLAMLLFKGRLAWRGLIICYAVAGLFLLPPVAYVVYQEAAQLEHKQEVVATTLFVPQDRSRLEQITQNTETYAAALYHLNWPLLILLPFAAIGMISAWRESLYLVGILAASWGFVVLASAFPSTRYLGLTFALALVGLALTMGRILTRLLGQKSPLGHGLIALYLLAALSGAFIRDAWDNPAALALGDQDEWEYFSHISSAYGLRDAAAELAEYPASAYVQGFVGSCHSLRFYLPEGVRLHCPYFRFYGNPALTTPDEWATLTDSAPRMYFLMEPHEELRQQPLFDALAQDSVLVAEYTRPDGVPVRLYEVNR